MNKIFGNKYYQVIARAFVAIIFIFAGMEKIADPASFVLSIENYKLLPEVLVRLTAIILPWIEVVAGILILFGAYIKENSLIIITLMVLFIFMIGIAVIRGLNIDCGCFGRLAATEVGLYKIIENVVITMVAITVYIFGGTKTENR